MNGIKTYIDMEEFIMSKLNYGGKIVVMKKDYEVSQVIDSVINLPSENVRGFFQKIGLTVPKSLRIKVLKEVLNDPVEKTLIERANLADELGYRLSWFDHFSEYQLESLLKFYKSVSLNKRYLSELWLHLFTYMIDKKVNEKEIQLLIAEASEFKEIPSDILAYNLALREIFFDNKNQIDGLSHDEFRLVLYKSSTVNEIREIGKKYDVDVPRRLKKEQLADIIIQDLKDRKEHNQELEDKIRAMSVVIMQRYAKDNSIKASIELKKEEVIEFILSHASQTKEAYFLPSDSSVYEKEVELRETPASVKEPVVVVEVPVVEEEIIVVEEKVEVVAKPSPQLEEVLKELALLRAELMDHLANCKCTKKQQEEQKEKADH